MPRPKGKQQLLEKRVKQSNPNKAPSKKDVDPTINKIVRGITSGIGNIISPGGGGVIGDMVGDKAHRFFKSITGVGDYKVSENTIMKDTVPSFARDKRSVRVAHREYLYDVTSSDVFLNTSVYINPANVTMFPWLNNLAKSYEQYRIHGMVFEFKSTSADALNSINTALGTVVLATQYSAADTPFKSKREMENYEFCVSTRPSASILHPVECKMSESVLDNLYIRPEDKLRYGISPTYGWDPRMYDFGIFNIAVVGMQQAGVNIGELWVSYDIELIKPKIAKTISGVSHYYSTTSTDASALLGMTEQDGSQLASYLTFGANTITFSPLFQGNVLINYVAKLSGGSVTANYSITPSGNATALNILVGDTDNTQESGSSAVTYAAVASFYINNGGVLTFSGGALGTRTGVDLFISSGPFQ